MNLPSMNRKTIVWAMALVVIVPFVFGLGYWLWWDQVARFQPHDIKRDQEAFQSLLDRSGAASPNLTGPSITIVTHRDCKPCRLFEETEAISGIQSVHGLGSLTDQMRNTLDGGHCAGGEGFAHISIGLGLAVGAEVFVVDGSILQPAGGSSLGVQRDQELPVAAIEVQKEGPLMQDRRGPSPPEVVALQVAALPQLLAGARI